MDDAAVPATGTCDLSTVGRRSGQVRRVETWYVVVDGRIVVTGTPGTRDWLANLRQDPGAIIHLRDPARDLAVTAQEVTERADRLRVVAAAWRLQPWYAEQPFSVEDWVARSPMVELVPTAGDASAD
ncbi:MAG: nitroreductase family deazaflavin-dependent oxidoreductase [Actinomycetales bacterium]|nr:nitroreductase family deazaflavin-dependent oxidoreductase [Actinomycetales bacterium]